jgi:hypothetical protein
MKEVSTLMRCGEGDLAVRLIKIGDSLREMEAAVTMGWWWWADGTGLAGLERGSVAYLIGLKPSDPSGPPASEGLVDKLLGALVDGTGLGAAAAASSLLSRLAKCFGPQKDVSIIGDAQRFPPGND